MMVSWEVGCEKNHGKPKIKSTLQQRHIHLPHYQVKNGNCSLHIRASSILLEHYSDPNQSETECYRSNFKSVSPVEKT